RKWAKWGPRLELAEMIADGARRRRADQRGETTDESHARLDDERIVAAVTDAASRGRIPESHDPDETTRQQAAYLRRYGTYVRTGGGQALRVIRSLCLVWSLQSSNADG
ncbi:hypothetical protein THAOC_26647, partial [Thalassiosira oceanica]